jgi:hypothetical protein
MTTQTPTKEAQAVIQVIFAVRDAIKELKEVPSGHLYASLMSKMSLESYMQIIDLLKKSGKVTESGNLLKWVE